MSDVETFYCLIVGSRSFSDYELFVAKCDLLLRNWGSVVIVSGGARGADALDCLTDVSIRSVPVGEKGLCLPTDREDQAFDFVGFHRFTALFL